MEATYCQSCGIVTLNDNRCDSCESGDGAVYGVDYGNPDAIPAERLEETRRKVGETYEQMYGKPMP